MEKRRAVRSPQEYRREWHLQNKYGLSSNEFDAWWIVFRGKCGICSVDLKLPLNRRGQPLDAVAVDHSHKSGKVRGLLCNGCNKGLGLFKDCVLNLKEATKWLEMCDEKTSKCSPD